MGLTTRMAHPACRKTIANRDMTTESMAWRIDTI